MLCPSCASHGLPQAQRIQYAFGKDIALLGLHCVFEHHESMTPVSLEAFLHEDRITFPVGVDGHNPGVTLPITMGRYQLRGTPSLVVIDPAGLASGGGKGSRAIWVGVPGCQPGLAKAPARTKR